MIHHCGGSAILVIGNLLVLLSAFWPILRPLPEFANECFRAARSGRSRLDKANAHHASPSHMNILLGEAMPALAWSGVMVAALGVRLCTDVSKPTYARSAANEQIAAVKPQAVSRGIAELVWRMGRR